MTTALLYMLDAGDTTTFRAEANVNDDDAYSSEDSINSNDSSISLAEDTKSLKLTACRKRSFRISQDLKSTSPTEPLNPPPSFQAIKKDFNFPLSSSEDVYDLEDSSLPDLKFSSLPEAFLRQSSTDTDPTDSHTSCHNETDNNSDCPALDLPSTPTSPITTPINVMAPPSDSTTDLTNHQLSSISPNHLGYHMKLNGNHLLIIDCRSFMKFNQNHIKGAINAGCTNSTIKKRFICNKIKVVDLVSGPEDKEKFREALSKDRLLLVLYDEDTQHVHSLTQANCLLLLASRLNQPGLKIRFLSGGMKEFLKSQAHHCSESAAMETKLLLSPTSPYVNAAIDTTLMTHILECVYLGNEKDACNVSNLLQEGITHLLNVSASIPLFCEGTSIIAKRLPSSDSGSQNIKQYFEEAIEFIQEARKDGGKVLIHCQAGVSRSPTITMAYLMARLKITSLEAFNFLKERRSIVSPNINFMGQLLEFEGKADLYEIEP